MVNKRFIENSPRAAIALIGNPSLSQWGYALQVPEGVDWAAVVKNAMDTYSVEIAGGLGPTVGKVWRVGIMGYNAKPQNIALVIEAFRDGLKKQGKL